MKIVGLIICLLHCLSLHSITIIGHRGACGYAPENTLSSFKKAIECNVDMIEFDVRKCASGELVVFHDAKVDRITDGSGFVALKTLQELKQLTILGIERISLLTEVLDYIDRRVKVYIELKDLNIIHDVLHIIDDYVAHKQWDYSDFLIASFDHFQLRDSRVINKEIPVAALIYGMPINCSICVVEAKADIVCLDTEFITQQFVDEFHARDMRVYVYTVNDKEQLINVLDYGIDGIITDFPDDMRALCI